MKRGHKLDFTTRPRLTPDDPRAVTPVKVASDALARRLIVRASGSQLDTWKLAAEIDGCSVSEWVRKNLDGAIAALLGDGD